MFLRGKSFNVKIVNDKLAADCDDESTNAVEGILTTQAYAAIARETISGIAGTIVTATMSIYVAKTVCTVVTLGARRLFR